MVAAVYRGDTLTFSFDSGAVITHLYPRYYEEYRQIIDSQYHPGILSLGGAGGIQEFKGVDSIRLELRIGGKSGVLENANLIIDQQYSRGEDCFGNLGQDYIGLFNTMAINFNKGSLWFE